MLSTCAEFYLGSMLDLMSVLPRDESQKSNTSAVHIRSSDNRDCEPIFSGTQNNAFIFLADLTMRRHILVKVGYLRAASYGSNCSLSGMILLKKIVRAI